MMPGASLPPSSKASAGARPRPLLFLRNSLDPQAECSAALLLRSPASKVEAPSSCTAAASSRVFFGPALDQELLSSRVSIFRRETATKQPHDGIGPCYVQFRQSLQSRKNKSAAPLSGVAAARSSVLNGALQDGIGEEARHTPQPLPSMADSSLSPEAARALAGLPRDARAVVLILDSMGVRDFEPRVVTQLLELAHRYTVEVLGDARAYSEHAGRSTVGVDDVKLAVQSRVNATFTQPPPRELLLELARVRNAVPLPPITTAAGVALPPEEDCLTAPNFQWATASVRAQQQQQQAAQRQLRTVSGKGFGAAGGPAAAKKRPAEDTEARHSDAMVWEPSGSGADTTKNQGGPAPTPIGDGERPTVSFTLGRHR